jgi:C7-cyclitol 7-kinase
MRWALPRWETEMTGSASALALVVEVGGTTTRMTCFYPGSDGPAELVRAPTPNYLTVRKGGDSVSLVRELFHTIRTVADRLLGDRGPDLVVMAYPGPMTIEGVALRSPTILGPDCAEAVDVKEHLARLWPAAQVHVINDLTAAGYFFVQRGTHDFCAITVGSGIGNKVFLEGRPQIGPHGFGGEIGHLKARPKPGSPVADVERDLGEIASGRGAAWITREWLERRPDDAAGSMLRELQPEADDDAWSRALAQAFVREDPLASQIVEAAAHPLAHAIGALHLNLGLERFFIVGGFARALGPRYQSLLSGLADEACWSLGQRWPDMIQVGDEGAEEGLSGACHLARTLAGRLQTPSVEAA